MKTVILLGILALTGAALFFTLSSNES